jgi:hypothetical protein
MGLEGEGLQVRRLKWTARSLCVLVISVGMPMVAPAVAKADDSCPDTLVSTTQQSDQLTALTAWYAFPTGGTLSRTVSSSWSNDSSLSGNFTLVKNAIQVQFGIGISHTYSNSTTATANVPAHYQARFRSRYKVWSNRIHQFNWNGRTCSDVGFKTKTAKHFVRFEAQVIPCNPACP